MKTKIGCVFVLLFVALSGCASVANHTSNPLIGGEWDVAMVSVTYTNLEYDRSEVLFTVSFDDKYFYLDGVPLYEYRFDGYYIYMKYKKSTNWDRYALVTTETGYLLVRDGHYIGWSLTRPVSP